MIDLLAMMKAGNIDLNQHFDALDTNSDGMLSADDCPFELGSPDAQLWWKTVIEPYIKTQVTDDMRDQYGDKCSGAFLGKPMVAGIKGSAENPQGDFDFVVHKIMVTQGLPQENAIRIASSMAKKLYG